jgi:hypothetical protein
MLDFSHVIARSHSIEDDRITVCMYVSQSNSKFKIIIIIINK